MINPITTWIYAANAALRRKSNLKKEEPPNLDGCLKILILFVIIFILITIGLYIFV